IALVLKALSYGMNSILSIGPRLKLEKARVYSRKQWIWLIALVCINQLSAWMDLAKPNIVRKLISWVEEAK
ncbi:hypothetical protein H5T89_11425, partial [bacterium]|nr:hypothetical protein [bacterium]